MTKKKWIMPFVALILVCMVGTLLIYPIINMQPKGITIGVLSLDKGTELPQGKVNLGDKLTDNITSATEDSSYSDVVIWKIYDDENQLRKDINKRKIHAGLIIPKDFTESQTSSIEGFNKLNDGLRKLADGMAKVDEGTSSFASGVSALPDSLSKLSSGTSAVNNGLIQLETSLGSKDSKNTLIFAASSVSQGVSGVKTALADQIAPAVTNLSSSLNSVKSVEAQITATLEVAAQKLAEGDAAGAQQAITTATELSKGASGDLGDLSDGTDALNTGISGLTEKIGTLNTGASAVSEGLVSVKSGISSLQNGAAQLDEGVSAFAGNSSTLVSGANALSEATGNLNSGVSTLSGSVSSMVDGIADQLTGESTNEQTEESESSILFVVNQGGNVTVASVVESMITKLFAQAGLSFETEYINPVDAGFTATYFGTCVFIFIYIVSYATGVLLTRNHPLTITNNKSRIKSALIQLIYAAALSLCACGIITWVISMISDMQLPVGDTFLFLSIAAFALIILVAGSIDLFGTAGMAIPVLMLVLGIGTANMPYEFLPEFWQTWIYPWMPLQIISNGIKQVVYTGAGWWNDLTGDLMIVVVIGLVLLAIATFKPAKEKTKTV